MFEQFLFPYVQFAPQILPHILCGPVGVFFFMSLKNSQNILFANPKKLPIEINGSGGRTAHREALLLNPRQSRPFISSPPNGFPDGEGAGHTDK